MDRLNLLIVDDEVPILNSLKFIFEKDFNVNISLSGEEAIELIKKDCTVDLVLSDERMAGVSGHDLLKYTHEHCPNSIGMLMTGFSNMGDLVDAVNLGHIYGYIHKPWRDDELKMLVFKAEQHYRLNIENTQLNEALVAINKELEMRVIKRTEELNQQKKLLKEANNYLSDLHQKSIDELIQAKDTQQFFLPEKFPSIPGIQIAVKYTPMQEIGGDIYDITELSDNRLGIWIADVTGHGISAALISMMMINLFKTYSFSLESLSLMFEKINSMLFKKIPIGKFATAFSMIFDPNSMSLKYSTAGHYPAYILRPSTGEILKLEIYGLLLGAFDNNIAKFNEASITLRRGDKVFIYTDGIIEIPQTNTPKRFGSENLRKLLKENLSLPIENLLETIYQKVLISSGQAEYDDDVTLIGFEVIE